MKKTLLKKGLLLGLAGIATISVASCSGDDDAKTYTYRTATSVSPSNWNELTYQDANDTQIMNFLGSSFFAFDFKYDADGNIVPGKFEVEYSAATKLEDVSSTYVGNEKYSVPEGGKGYAYRITLRDDLKWNDGTAIKAKDFVYTMKQQLDPDFKNYRADSYYNGSLVIHAAKDYFYQGSTGVYPADTAYATYSTDLDSKLVFKLGPAAEENDVASFRGSMGVPGSWEAADLASYLAGGYLAKTAFTAEVAAKMEGKTLAEIKADAEMKAAWDALIGWWQTEPDEELDFFVADYTFPEVDFNDVGIFAESDTQLVVVLDKSLELLNDDGTMSYQAAYSFSSLPLVKEDLYEANKVAPQTGSTLWTTTYNSSVSSTASWGPYMLTEFQAGKNYVLEKNPNWFGYGLDQYKGQYQTDKITCETIAEYNTRLMKFNAGELDDIGIDVSVAADYRNSSQAIYTPDDYVGSLQLQSNVEALKNNQKAGQNKVILSYIDFRKAMSLSVDRAAYTAACTTSSLAGFGIFTSVHYYDVANGGVYRNTDAAKKTLCDAYGVPYTDANLDEQYKKITGYDLTQARTLFTKAYNEALAAGDIQATDKVVLKFGTSTDSEAVRRHYNYLTNAWIEAVKTTPLEGKLEFEFDASYGSTWANSFRSGAYELCLGGWQGAAWDPGYFLLAYLSPDYMYSKSWDTSSEVLEFTMPGKYLEDGKDLTATKSLMEWYYILNGQSEDPKAPNWAAGKIDDEARCLLIAALEKAILAKYYTVPLYYTFSSEMISYKIEYATRTYNTFMGYGGVRYMTYNYSDAEWAKYVKKNGGSIDYKA